MAKPKKKAGVRVVTTTEEVVRDDDDTPEETADKERLDDEVVRALTELDGAEDIKWQVHRRGGLNPGYCRPAMTTSELTLENIAQRHGPGHYQIKGVRADGSYFRSATITIAEAYKPEDKTEAIVNALTQRPAAGNDNTLLVALMNQNTQVLTAALARPEKPDKEIPWKEIIVASPLILTGIKEFFTRKDAEEASLEKLLKMVTVVEKLKGGSGEGSTWTDVLRDALQSLSPLVSRAAAPVVTPAPVPAAVRVISPASNGVPATTVGDSAAGTIEALPATPEAVAASPEVEALAWLKDQLERLVQKAAMNRDAELYAEVFLDEKPESIPDSLVIELLSGADWFDKLQQFEPRVQPYFGWFENFAEALIAQLQEGAEDNGKNHGNDDGRTESAVA